MATSTRTTRAKKTEENKETRMQEASRSDIKQAMAWVATNTNSVPTLVGPTASGKTWLAREWAEEIDAELITVLLQQHTPDEIAGFQTEINGQLELRMPEWFRRAEEAVASKKKVVIVFDELGLARDEVKGALYTFFRDRHLHNRHLGLLEEYEREIVSLVCPKCETDHIFSKGNPNLEFEWITIGAQCRRCGEGTPFEELEVRPGTETRTRNVSDVYVVAAMNPATLAPPYQTRAVMLHVPADRSYMMSIAKNPIAMRVAEAASLSIDTDAAFSNDPPAPPAIATAATVDILNQLNKDFWDMSEPAQRLVLQAVIPPNVLEEVMRDRIDVNKLVRKPELLHDTLLSVPPVDALSLIASALETLPQLEGKPMADLMWNVLDAVYSNPRELALPYFEIERPEHIRNACLNMDGKHFWSIIEKEGSVGAKDGYLTGKWVENWIAAGLAEEE